jgi:hypothetical protein
MDQTSQISSIPFLFTATVFIGRMVLTRCPEGRNWLLGLCASTHQGNNGGIVLTKEPFAVTFTSGLGLPLQKKTWLTPVYAVSVGALLLHDYGRFPGERGCFRLRTGLFLSYVVERLWTHVSALEVHSLDLRTCRQCFR